MANGRIKRVVLVEVVLLPRIESVPPSPMVGGAVVAGAGPKESEGAAVAVGAVPKDSEGATAAVGADPKCNEGATAAGGAVPKDSEGAAAEVVKAVPKDNVGAAVDCSPSENGGCDGAAAAAEKLGNKVELADEAGCCVETGRPTSEELSLRRRIRTL